MEQQQVKDIKQLINENITRYQTLEEYLKRNNLTHEEFEELEAQDGVIYEITMVGYNGAKKTFTPLETTIDNLIFTIMDDIRDCDYYERLEDFTDGSEDIDYVLAYVESYEVFTIGNLVYNRID